MVSRWLIILSLLFSALLLGLTGWHEWQWQHANDQMLSRRLQSINRVFTPSLAEAVQNHDMSRVHGLLVRLTSDPAILNATLRDERGTPKDFTGSMPPPALPKTLPSKLSTWNHDGIGRWIQPLESFLEHQPQHRYWLDLSLDPRRANSAPERLASPWTSLVSLLLLLPAALAWRQSRRPDNATDDKKTPIVKMQVFTDASAAPWARARLDSDLTYVSHELRAPLSGVLGFCRLLENSPLDPQQREWLRHIHLASNGLLDTVDQVLGDTRRHRTDDVFDIAEVLWEVLRLQAPLAQSRRITLLPIVYDDVPPRLIGTDLGVRQLLTNLINNAIKYGGEGDVVIRVVLESREDSAVRLRLSVTDGGNPDPIHRERLRRAIEREQAETVDAEAGVGVAICYRLAAEMNGSLALGAPRGREQTVVANIGLEACEPYVRPAEFDLEGAVIALWQPHVRLAHLLDHALKRWHARPRPLNEPEALITLDESSQLSIIGIDEKALEPATHRTWQQRFDAMRHACLLIANIAPTHTLTWRLPEGSVILRLPISRYMLGRALARMLAESRQRHLPPRPRILIVDDDEVSQHYLDALLPAIGADASVAQNAEEALNIATERTVDLVLMDLHLPDASGFEAARRLRCLNGEWKRKPIIAMTAEPEAHRRHSLTEGAIDEMLIKPLDERRLKDVLARHLPDTMPLAASPISASSYAPRSKTAPSETPHAETSFSEQALSPARDDSPRPPPALHTSDLPVVDKAEGLRISGDRETLAVEMTNLLIADLPIYRQALQAAWRNRDAEKLSEIVHQLGGGSRYCGVPQLTAACERLERHCCSRSLGDCEGAFHELMAACDRLITWADDQTITDTR